ncbi:hypothetical protein ACTOJ1_000171 [Shigella flexneri]
MSSEVHKKLGSWVAGKLADKEQRLSEGEDATVVLNDYNLAFNAAKQVLVITDVEEADLESLELALELIDEEFEDLERSRQRAAKRAKLEKIAAGK